LDETGVLLGLTRSHARSLQGTRVYDLKPFYRGSKVTAIGAISLKKVVALMTIDDSIDGKVFEVFIEQYLVPQLWSGAVVVMDNLPAHKKASIVPMIEAIGARIICLSPYSPDFNPIECWWSQLKSFLRRFAPTTTKMVDTRRCSCTRFNQSSTFKKLGKLIAVIVLHNSGNRCINTESDRIVRIP
jgi:transposase